MDRKLLLGIILIMASMIIGLLYKFYIVAEVLGNQVDWAHLWNSMVDPIVAWSTIIYLLSWPMLFVGIYLCGKEGMIHARQYTKYLTYQHYHEAAKRQIPVKARRHLQRTRRMLMPDHVSVKKQRGLKKTKQRTTLRRP